MFWNRKTSGGPYDTLISQLAVEKYNVYQKPFSLKASPAGQHLLTATPEEQIGFVFAAIDWLINVTKPTFRGALIGDMTPSDIVRAAIFEILRRRLPLDHDQVNSLLQWAITQKDLYAAPPMVKIIEDYLTRNKDDVRHRGADQTFVRSAQTLRVRSGVA